MLRKKDLFFQISVPNPIVLLLITDLFPLLYFQSFTSSMRCKKILSLQKLVPNPIFLLLIVDAPFSPLLQRKKVLSLQKSLLSPIFLLLIVDLPFSLYFQSLISSLLRKKVPFVQKLFQIQYFQLYKDKDEAKQENPTTYISWRSSCYRFFTL